MASSHIRREIMAALMESPFYFNIPLRERLEFLKLFSRQSLTLAPNWPGEGGGLMEMGYRNHPAGVLFDKRVLCINQE